jgi:hypothetical protein
MLVQGSRWWVGMRQTVVPLSRGCVIAQTAVQPESTARYESCGPKPAQKIQNERREDLANLRAIRRIVGRPAIRLTRGFSLNQIAVVLL